MLEEKPTSLGQILIRGIVGLLLAVLVLMLIVTFLPGDLEQNLLDQVTGRMSSNAGSVGNRSIPMDYFNSARKECYFRYKEYAPQMAGNEEMLTNCAYQTIRTVYIAGQMAKSMGYQISELAIKRELSRQARELYKQSSTQAGYSEDDIRSPEEIYKNLLRSEPLHYRTESSTALSLFDNFLRADLNTTPSEINIQNDAKNAKISLRLVGISDLELISVVESELVVSDEEAKKEYDKEVKAGTGPKGADGKALSFEARKSILLSKIRLDKKNRAVEEKKSALKIKKEQGSTLEDIANELKQKPINLSNLSIQDLSSVSNNGQVFRLTQDNAFLQDMGNLGFGSKKIGGPYKSGDKTIFVEFTDLKIPQSNSDLSKIQPNPDDKRLLFSFFLEMNQSISKENPLLRNSNTEIE
jgi:hypothetical protein